MLTVSCRDAVRAFGPGSTAAAHADQVFAAFAARYTSLRRTVKYDSARVRIAHGAFVPSRVFEDTSVWTTINPVTRTLLVWGGLRDGRYDLEARRAVPLPTSVGESRHAIALTRLAGDEFVWDTSVDFGVGSVTAPDVGAVAGALLEAAEGRGEHDLRADYRGSFPRAAAALGRLFEIDTLRTGPAADGATDVLLVVGLRPERLQATLPAFGAYMQKYAGRTQFRLQLFDHGGTPWFDVAGRGRDFAVRFRARQGRLVPLVGGARPFPDSLALHATVTTRVRMFTVGFRDLVADFAIGRGEHERAWTIHARREPSWVLPLASRHLLRTPLRRPFQGEGVLFRVAVRDSAGTQTMLSRRTHLVVQESAILRFLGGLGSHAVNDYDDRAEREGEVFMREAFQALQADVRALGRTAGAER